MTKYLAAIAIFFSSCESSNKEITIRKIPCDEIYNYSSGGKLEGYHLTKYYAVNFSDTIPFNTIKGSMDTILENLVKEKYPRSIVWFLKESDDLKQIRNCEITDGHNIGSSDHKLLVMFVYNRDKNFLEQVSFDSAGNYASKPFFLK